MNGRLGKGPRNLQRGSEVQLEAELVARVLKNNPHEY